ncbi:MAG: DUF523 domain-containing protein [Firmicutes bacterium]|nr:DUF523 domain-containing protein [Bacillota bacterium]
MERLIAVSACLLGYNCKYNGSNNLNFNVIEKTNGMKIIPICPEVFGGMPTPRIPSEISIDQEKVYSSVGEEVTFFFEQGKKRTLELLKEHHCTKVILKDGSPSCGYSYIYDGTFTGSRILGQGITCKYLLANGIEIIDLNQEGQL